MRYIGYRWDEIIQGLDGSSRLNVHWQRSFVETSLDGFSVTAFPTKREVLVFEGDAALIAGVREAAESFYETVRTAEERKA